MQDLETEMSQGGRQRKMASSGEHGGGGGVGSQGELHCAVTGVKC